MSSSAKAPSAKKPRRSRTRRAGESAYGLLLAGRALMGFLALLLLVAGAWASWPAAQHVMFPQSREHGTMTVARCGAEHCTGPFAPVSDNATRRSKVIIERSVAADEGAEVPVVLKPGTTAVVRSGFPGLLHAWIPLGGALLLASVVVAGGMRMRRTAWGLAGVGALLLTGAFVLL
ncbi:MULTISPECIES: hypothetical protein [unclassified Streptomyces]|uniref:hypothetical protein n=1 Tax=unclassified Streptomyces TaxID=2593676 RepID=UPI00203F7C36|nr:MULTISPECIES: hypothetical protein [unclassified Streptomyces]